jgi:hypothetical protein
MLQPMSSSARVAFRGISAMLSAPNLGAGARTLTASIAIAQGIRSLGIKNRAAVLANLYTRGRVSDFDFGRIAGQALARVSSEERHIADALETLTLASRVVDFHLQADFMESAQDALFRHFSGI